MSIEFRVSCSEGYTGAACTETCPGLNDINARLHLRSPEFSFYSNAMCDVLRNSSLYRRLLSDLIAPKEAASYAWMAGRVRNVTKPSAKKAAVLNTVIAISLESAGK